MEHIVIFFPFILMLIVGFVLYKYYRNKKVEYANIEDQKAQKIWKKARWGLYIIIPFVAIFDIINNNVTGSSMHLLPTILNFFITRYLIKTMIRNGVNFVMSYPKLATIGVSILVLIIQVSLGRLIAN